MYVPAVTFDGDSAKVTIDIYEPLSNAYSFSWILNGTTVATTSKPEYKIKSSNYYPGGWICNITKTKVKIV